MGITVAAIAVVGGIVYILFVLMAYFADSGRLSQELQAFQVRLGGQRKRLEEYEERAALLGQEIPALEEGSDRVRRWVELLRKQKTHVETEQQNTKLMSHQERKAAVRKDLGEHRRGTRE
jgi:hypothetical protein